MAAKTNKRKKYLVDKEYQHKTALSILKISSAIAAFIVSIFIANMVYNNMKLSSILHENAGILQKIDNIMIVQDNLFGSLRIYAQTVQDPHQKMSINEFTMDHIKNLTTIKNNMAIMKNNISINNSIINNNRIMFVIIIILIIVQGAAIYIFTIRQTHKISGPLIKIKGFLNDIIEGSESMYISLRSGDELQDLSELLLQAVKTLKNKEKQGK